MARMPMCGAPSAKCNGLLATGTVRTFLPTCRTPGKTKTCRWTKDPTKTHQKRKANWKSEGVERRRILLTRCAAGSEWAMAASPEGEGPKLCSDLRGSEKKRFRNTRFVVFLGILIGYASYYITRNSLVYTAPVMVASDSLNLDITNVGQMTSIFPIAYGMSKFVSGVLGAKLSPRVLLAGGLAATAVVNILFGFGTSMVWFCSLWAMNGILQGFGGPCCARILTSWFATQERGTYWGMWNIAHNLGGFTAPLIAGTAARALGWQWGMWAPGIIGAVIAVFLLFAVKDSPESAGFPPVEVTKDSEPVETEESAEEISLWDNLVQNVLTNPYIWGMALSYFFIYVLRQGVTSWSVFFLMKAKGVADVAAASYRVSGLELGGLAGSLLAGRLSDAMIARSKGKGGNVGKRVQVVMGYTIGIAAMLCAFWLVPASWGVAQWAIVFMIGFFLYGPQMLIGLCGAELVGPASVGASEGFLGWVAYLGAANAGVPLSIIVKQYGWNAFFVALLAACGMALLLLSPMINLKSYVQREEAKAKHA
uniref:Major facilitator superfamily (MFS) profile domain-containing protein n=1 Tax=Picocystis salinarum TaxID=88271 RepID=A0A6U9RBK6_9CHLO|mmetsp:Transcript_6980/g.42761  ORF Transcript_6980/g.42761 Transcript_6980/m.42761 type:complete len:537 (-) Transcript_6980:2067-3677(-)